MVSYLTPHFFQSVVAAGERGGRPKATLNQTLALYILSKVSSNAFMTIFTNTSPLKPITRISVESRPQALWHRYRM